MDYLKKIKLKEILITVGLGVCIQVFASIVLTEIISFFPKTSGEYAETVGALTKLTLKTVLYVCLIAPLVEEFVFRGFIMQFAELKLKFFAANVIQAALFSMYHSNVVQKIYAAILGLFIGYIVYKLGNIVYGIIFHITLNSAGVIQQNYFADMSNRVINIIAALISLACLIFLVKSVLKTEKKCTES